MTSAAPTNAAPSGLVAVRTKVLGSVFEDLKIAPDRVRTLEDPPTAGNAEGRSALVGVEASAPNVAALASRILQFAEREAGSDGTLCVFCLGERRDAEIALLRNALWPAWHVVALYETSNRQITRVAIGERRDLGRGCGQRGRVVVARRSAAVLAPDATVLKFDKNAAGWNGNPGTPGYAHFRWMRQYVGTFADASRARRILDFGCGAGWVGIEAVLAARATNTSADPELAAFDPSSEMVKLAEENARASKITRFVGRTGFGEAPPFPAAGEERFDLVISSGVISFSGDQARWIDGLLSTLAPGGTLVIGDIHRESAGMQRRRAEKPLLPVREMNARTREEVRALLEKRGLVFEAWCGYQLSRPVPELMHWQEKKLGGVLSGALLGWNRRATAREARSGSQSPNRFDSWVMRFRAP